MKKKKPKPPKIHLVHPMMMPLRKMHKEKGRSFPNGRQTWVIGDRIDSSNSGAQVSTSGILGSSSGDERSTDDQSNRFGDERSISVDDSSSLGHEVSSSGMHSDVDTSVRQGRGIMADLWKIGEEALDVVAEHALEAENKDNGIQDKSSFAGDGCILFYILNSKMYD